MLATISFLGLPQIFMCLDRTNSFSQTIILLPQFLQIYVPVALHALYFLVSSLSPSQVDSLMSIYHNGQRGDTYEKIKNIYQKSIQNPE